MQNPELSALPLKSKWKSHLHKANYLTSAEVLLTPPSVLAKRTKLPVEETRVLLVDLALAVGGEERTVAELLGLREGAVRVGGAGKGKGLEVEVEGEQEVEEETAGESVVDWISMGDPGLDALLGNGVRLGTITEVAGQSAAGKSHFALQLAAMAQLPLSLGGLSGGTIFISSEGILSSSRLLTFSHSILSRLSPSEHSDLCKTAWDFLDNVHTVKAQDAETLDSLLSFGVPAQIEHLHDAATNGLLLLPSSIPSPSERTSSPRPPLPIKLLVIDSIGALFRGAHHQSSGGFISRSKEFGQIGDRLKRLAHVYRLAIVVINQVSDVFEHAPSFPPSLRPTSSPTRRPHEQHSLPPLLYSRYQVPHFSGQSPGMEKQAALGYSWSNIVNARIMLSRTEGGRRRMEVVFGPGVARGRVEFELEEEGLRSVGEVVRRAGRESSIGAKLVALGWTWPDVYVLRFKSPLFDQPTNLTDQIWEKIKSTILAEVQEAKNLRLQYALEDRQQQRAQFVKPFLDRLRKPQPDHLFDIFHSFKAFIMFETVRPLWESDGATIDHQASLGGMNQVDVEAELETFRRTTILAFFRHLATSLDAACTPFPLPLLAKLDPPHPADSSPPSPTITDAEMRPYFSLFTSQAFCAECENFHAFPAIFDHLNTPHARTNDVLPGPYTTSVSSTWVSAMSNFFDAAGIDEAERTEEELKMMGAGFGCERCAKDQRRGWEKAGKGVPVVGLKWSEMVEHAFEHHLMHFSKVPCEGIEYVVPPQHAPWRRMMAN